MSRIRLNQEFRNKIGTRMRVHVEAEDTQEKQDYDNKKADLWYAQPEVVPPDYYSLSV